MEIRIDRKGDSEVAVVKDGGILIGSVQDALDIMATVQHVYHCGKMVIGEGAFVKGFFDLSTRLAGEILQKFTNYQFKVAIVGDFGRYESKALKDFIYESNKGRAVFFLPDEAAALKKLHNIR